VRKIVKRDHNIQVVQEEKL